MPPPGGGRGYDLGMAHFTAEEGNFKQEAVAGNRGTREGPIFIRIYKNVC